MHDWLAARAARSPDALALIDADTGSRYTYRELQTAVESLAGGLLASEIGPGARVGTLCPRGPDAIILVWAILRTGATLVPLDVSVPPEKTVGLVNTASLDHLVFDPGQDEKMAAGVPEAVRTHSLTSVHAAADASETTPTVSDRPISGALDKTRVLLFTSGTTGDQKAVRLNPRNIGTSAAGSAFRLGVEPGDRWLLTLPLYHMGGLAIPLRSALYGTAVVVEEDFVVSETASNIETYEVTGISLVPTMLKRLLDQEWRPASLRFALVGGAPTPEPLARRALEAAIPVYTTYGMTETASQVATATPADLHSDPSTVGRPLSTVSVTVLDEDGSRQEAGETGEIVVAGPVVSPGYLDGSWTKPDTGWFHTGDEGYLDEDGRLYVTGRQSDLIITGGENVHPREVEAVFREEDSVEEVAVVGLPDENWGQRVAALVVPTDDPSVEELEAAVAENLADYAVPKTISFTNSIPRTRSGTVDRAAVQRSLSETDQ